MRRRLIELAVLGAVVGFLGFAVVASGIVPIKASSGHWPITRWFLTFAMRRSVDTHSIGTRVPDLEDEALVLRGAGHYARACQPCHGAPGERRSAVTLQSTPQPPYLPEEVPLWDAAELFHIVKHGVKFTGMPAWPALERDDEVWAMVAFLLRLPDLEPAEYERLAWPDTVGVLGVARLGEAPEEVAETCAQCHGPDGLGRGSGAFPKLAGQSPSYLAAALRAYALGRRRSGIMQAVAAPLAEEAVRELALYYGRSGEGAAAASADAASRADPPAEAAAPRSGPPAEAAAPQSDPALLGRGEGIAREGIPRRKVPSCVPCHGPGDEPRNPFYPNLAGQYAAYLDLQLRLFREDRRGGSAYAHIMREVTHRLEPEDAAAVAAWYASLPWGESPPASTPVPQE